MLFKYKIGETMEIDRKTEIKYYFCRDVEYQGYKNRQIFAITPKDYFDKKGFLIDTGSFNPNFPEFQRISDSYFEYVGYGDPEIILLDSGVCMWRDMLTEIKYTYKRRRLLGMEPKLINSLAERKDD